MPESGQIRGTAFKAKVPDPVGAPQSSHTTQCTSSRVDKPSAVQGKSEVALAELDGETLKGADMLA